MKTVRVKVNAETIQDGSPRKACWCPVALALEAATGFIWAVHSGIAERIMSIADREPANLPLEVVERIDSYDLTEVMDPFEFDFTYSGEAK